MLKIMTTAMMMAMMILDRDQTIMIQKRIAMIFQYQSMKAVPPIMKAAPPITLLRVASYNKETNKQSEQVRLVVQMAIPKWTIPVQDWPKRKQLSSDGVVFGCLA